MAKSILLADDEQMILKAMEFKLKRDGYNVHIAEDGKQALSIIESQNPDLVITDLMMPFHSGLEVITEAKKKNIPVIVLSAVGLEDNVVEAFRLGADDFVTKPFSPHELSIRVHKLLS